jgi:signal transduction histidine kinase
VAALVAAEQGRIARELHDLVAHALAVIVLQSQAARRVVDVDPAQAREALGAIEDVGREGLVELRRLLDVLDPVAADDDASRPGLDQLTDLATRVRGAGLPVEVVVSGPWRSLPAGLDLSAYRIVQEALTNTLKHAGPARSRVAVRYLPDAVEVEVVDDGAGGDRRAVDQRVGRGLIGMRERTALYGGTLVAGSDPAGEGFRVQARFPLGATP